jgi:hypothetical protein
MGTNPADKNGYVYLNKHTLAAIKDLIQAIHEATPGDNMNRLPLWTPVIEDLLDLIEKLLDRARIYACVQGVMFIKDDDDCSV